MQRQMRTVSVAVMMIAGLAVVGVPSFSPAEALGVSSAETTLSNDSAVEHTVGLVDPSQGLWHLRSPSGDLTSLH
jgi:hypothetical protein